MKKIFFETLKHKLGHYLLVIFCGILMVSTIYVSYAFSDSIEGIINGQNSGIVEEMYTFINFQETYILLFILMVLVIISYIRKKSYDYVLLDTMGLKKKHRYMFIGFEYAGIIFSSVTGGLILGKILAECAKTVLQNIFYNTITTEVNYGFVALRNTLVISCEVFGILFIVFDEVIFSDEYYQKNCVKADGANMAVMMNIPENYDKVVEEIKAYAQDHSQVNYFDADNGNLIYEKKELLLERSKTKLLYVASAAGNIIIMLLCGIFVLSIKMECDFPETEWKYRFYIQSGMSSAKVRKGIIKECLLSGGLPVICGTIISILYCSMLLYAKHLQIEWVHRYFKGIILIVGAIWLLFAVFSLIFAYRNIRKIEGDSRDGKK